MRPTVDELLEQGAQQVSRKYRMVAKLPPGETGREALERLDSQYARDVERRIEEQCADTYRRIYAEREGNSFELTVEEFAEFLRKTGRSDWTPKFAACEHCKSFGHHHTPDCPNRGKRR